MLRVITKSAAAGPERARTSTALCLKATFPAILPAQACRKVNMNSPLDGTIGSVHQGEECYQLRGTRALPGGRVLPRLCQAPRLLLTQSRLPSLVSRGWPAIRHDVTQWQIRPASPGMETSISLPTQLPSYYSSADMKHVTVAHTAPAPALPPYLGKGGGH